jgi:KinB signaling pathway activation protein
LEWIPVLRVNEKSWVYLMLFPLVICNAYQILMLPKYLKRSEEERAILNEKKNKSNAPTTAKKSNNKKKK